jgi:CRP-like cAMP-binding protein
MLTEEEKINLLRSVEMFGDASDSTLAKLAALSKEVSSPAGEEIIVQGQRCPNLFILVSGELGIYLKDGDHEREIVRLNLPGKAVGDIGVISGASSTATIRTLAEETRFLKLEERHFQSIVNSDPRLSEAVLRSLVRYL